MLPGCATPRLARDGRGPSGVYAETRIHIRGNVRGNHRSRRVPELLVCTYTYKGADASQIPVRETCDLGFQFPKDMLIQTWRQFELSLLTAQPARRPEARESDE